MIELAILAAALLALYFMRPRRVHVIALPRPLEAIMYSKGDGIVVRGKTCRVVSVDRASNSLMVRET